MNLFVGLHLEGAVVDGIFVGGGLTDGMQRNRLLPSPAHNALVLHILGPRPPGIHQRSARSGPAGGSYCAASYSPFGTSLRYTREIVNEPD